MGERGVSGKAQKGMLIHLLKKKKKSHKRIFFQEGQKKGRKGSGVYYIG